MIARDFIIDIRKNGPMKVTYDGTNGGLVTRYIRDIQDMRQFFMSKANEGGLKMSALRIRFAYEDWPDMGESE